MPKRPALPRRIPKEIAKPVRSHAIVIGEVVWASNHLMMQLLPLYINLFPRECSGIAHLTWHTQRTDSSQLTLIEAATKGHDSLTKSVSKRIFWAVRKAKSLGELRNDAVHAAIWFRRGPKKQRMILSTLGTHPARVERLMRLKDFNRFYSVVTRDLMQLALYVAYFPDYMWKNRPSPRKPQLRSVPDPHRKPTRGSAKTHTTS
jgi:hypothetical protein